MKKRKEISKFGFIVSTLGAAIGLGNVWGFPTLLKDNGGLVFLLLYILALITCSIPILIFEFNVGNIRRKSTITIFDEENPKVGQFMGWFQVGFMFIIANFYTVLIGYVLISTIMEFTNVIATPSWFDNNILESSSDSIGVTSSGGFQWLSYIAFIVIIVAVGGINFFRSKGIEKANMIFIPLLFIILLILSIYILTLKGAIGGIAAVLVPTKDSLKSFINPSVWGEAFSLGIFTVCVGSGFMLLFAGNAEKGQDNTNKSWILATGVLTISLLVLVLVFGSVGVIIHDKNPNISSFEEYKSAMKAQFTNNNGMSFIFNILPQTFNILNNRIANGFGNTLGVLFFSAILFAGLSSVISMLEVVISSITSNYKVNEKKTVVAVTSSMLVIGIGFMFSKTSNNMIDISGKFAGSINMILLSLLELVIVIHWYKKLDFIIENNNKTSWIKINKTFKIFIKYVTPVLLVTIIGFMLYTAISAPIVNPDKNPWWISVLALVVGIGLPLAFAWLSIKPLKKYQTTYKQSFKNELSRKEVSQNE